MTHNNADTVRIKNKKKKHVPPTGFIPGRKHSPMIHRVYSTPFFFFPLYIRVYIFIQYPPMCALLIGTRNRRPRPGSYDRD